MSSSDKNSNQRANEASGMRYEAINDQTVSQTSYCRYLNKLLMLKGKIDFFIREIPEELYYTNYKKPVVVFENGKTTLVEGFKKKKIVEDDEAD